MLMGNRVEASSRKRPTRAQFTRLLLDLGFRRQVVPTSHVAFVKGRTTITLPAGRGLHLVTVLAAGKILVAHNRISLRRWERWFFGR